MSLKQVSVFIENEEGRLASITQSLENNKINIRALSLADTSDFGVLRLIVDKTEEAIASLKKDGFIARVTDVLAVEVGDAPGGLNKVLSLFDANKLNVEYMYAFVEKRSNNAIVIFRMDDILNGMKVLKENNIPLVYDEDLKNL